MYDSPNIYPNMESSIEDVYQDFDVFVVFNELVSLNLCSFNQNLYWKVQHLGVDDEEFFYIAY